MGPQWGLPEALRSPKILRPPIEGKDILIVEDIIGSGHTFEFLKDRIALFHPHSIQRNLEVMLQSRCSLHRRDLNHTPA